MTTSAVKLTVIVERLLKPAVQQLLTNAGVAGWAVFPGGGMGAHGLHRAEAAQLVRDFAIVRIEAVLRDRDTAKGIARTLTTQYLADQPGIVWLSPVEVWRAGRFRDPPCCLCMPPHRRRGACNAQTINCARPLQAL